MTAPRSRKEARTYKKYQAKLGNSVCEFCLIKPGDKQFIAQTKAFLIMRNIFPYSIWDSQRVTDHLLVIPRQHTDSLANLSALQASEFLKLISKYEQQGYNVYARAPSSEIKTVEHQHTHLIKTTGPPRKFVFLLRRPYIRIVF